MKPIVKWVGGKTRILPELRELVGELRGRYYEPFLGGGALLFDRAPEAAVVGDLQPDLIEMYRAIAGDPSGVSTLLEEHMAAYVDAADQNEYYRVARHTFNSGWWAGPERAAALMFLNRTCFNGLWRVNGKGRFNSPHGKYIRPNYPGSADIAAAAAILRRCLIYCAPYQETTEGAGAGDVVYFDPPYDATYNSYTEGGFAADDQRLLRDHAAVLRARGCRVVLSNSDTPLIRELYSDFQIREISVPDSVGGKGAARQPRSELLISG